MSVTTITTRGKFSNFVTTQTVPQKKYVKGREKKRKIKIQNNTVSEEHQIIPVRAVHLYLPCNLLVQVLEFISCMYLAELTCVCCFTLLIKLSPLGKFTH